MVVAALNDPAALAHPDAAGRIGPDAVLQLAEVLLAEDGPATRARIFEAAGLRHHLMRPPDTMVEEAEVAALFTALGDELGQVRALHRLRKSGSATAAYLLTHSIPPFARLLLPSMPTSFAAVLLTRSIQRHGWTFLGTGALDVVRGDPLGIRIRLARPLVPVARLAGEFYRATFEGLFRALVHDAARAEPQPTAGGVCRFDITWSGHTDG